MQQYNITIRFYSAMKDFLIKAAIMLPLFYLPYKLGYLGRLEATQFLILAEVFNISFLLNQLVKEAKDD